MSDVIQLRDRIPSLMDLDLPVLLERAAQHAIVERGQPVEDTTIADAERALGVVFPADLCAFFRDFGGLRILGSTSYDFGLLVVHGLDGLGAARAELRRYLDEEKYEPCWVDVTGYRTVHKPAAGKEPFFADYEPPPRDPEKEHAEFCARVDLPRDAVPAFLDDDFNVNRFGYRHLVPVIQSSSLVTIGVDCVGPLGRMFYFDARDQIVEYPSAPFRKYPPSPPDDTFTAILKTQISKVIVGPTS